MRPWESMPRLAGRKGGGGVRGWPKVRGARPMLAGEAELTRRATRERGRVGGWPKVRGQRPGAGSRGRTFAARLVPRQTPSCLTTCHYCAGRSPSTSSTNFSASSPFWLSLFKWSAIDARSTPPTRRATQRSSNYSARKWRISAHPTSLFGNFTGAVNWLTLPRPSID
jgi:hypothetical protein